uniref:NADH-ubiquinone oxidoreductase chain 3 n=1 Tax=Acerella muscorum TaxID=187596 RepID=A0A0C4K2L5_9HEXA|nr:NADH dehydrogenase subunit 3 [Acerella muscorum]AHL42962.1 NADH dehydrogenase subunit 3 [Acerella muscorum]
MVLSVLLELIMISFVMMMNSLLNFFFSKKIQFKREKMTPFECGFEPKKMFRSSFSLRFFYILLIFLIFDVEIVIILPMPYCMFNMNFFLWVLMFTIFLLILIFGLIMEWSMGSISWS